MLLLDLNVEAGVVEGLDERLGVEIAGDLERLPLWLGGVAGDALDLFDGCLDRFAAVAAAIVSAGQGEALDLAGGDAAVVLDLQVLVAAAIVSAGQGEEIGRAHV